MIIATFYCYYGEGVNYEAALDNLIGNASGEYSDEDIENRLDEVKFYEAEPLNTKAKRMIVFITKQDPL